jgi:hypothetical protein
VAFATKTGKASLENFRVGRLLFARALVRRADYFFTHRAGLQMPRVSEAPIRQVGDFGQKCNATKPETLC